MVMKHILMDVYTTLDNFFFILLCKKFIFFKKVVEEAHWQVMKFIMMYDHFKTTSIKTSCVKLTSLLFEKRETVSYCGFQVQFDCVLQFQKLNSWIIDVSFVFVILNSWGIIKLL